MVDVWSGGARSPVALRSFLEGGVENPNIRLAGVYETGASRLYHDVSATHTAIDAATTLQQMTDAFATLAQAHAITVTVTGTARTKSTWTLTGVAVGNPRLKPFLHYLADSLSQLAPGWLTASIHVGDEVFSDSGNPMSGVAFPDTMETYLSVTQAPSHLITVGGEDEKAHPAITMHELGHLLEFAAPTGVVSTMDSGLKAANPPGFAYGAPNAPYTGEHPVGFPRFYGRTSRVEDFADMVAYMTVPALYPTLVRWMQADPYLVKKHAVVKRFLADIGWGTYVIEDMHGHVPQVHPL